MDAETGSGHLPRGKACVPCRRRKMKCDGNQPKCNQCVRFNRQDECEFSEVVPPSSSKMLEQYIELLKGKIQELEEDDPTRVRLHHPHASIRPQPPASQQRWWEMPEPPRREAHTIVTHFIPHAQKFGFFLDVNRFMTAFFTPTDEKPRPPSVLRNAVYLWGIHLSQDPSITAHEPQFLTRALNGIVEGLSNQPRNTLSILQAEVLLAYYFFHNGRLLEGGYHAGAAVSLAVMCDLHKIPTRQGRRPGADPSSLDLRSMGLHGLSLPPPKDAIEEGERIHAWWTTYVLDKAWVVARNSPSAIYDDGNNEASRIDTPWPIELNQYGQVPRAPGGRTIQTFLESLPTGRVDAPSYLAMQAQAATLYERASKLASVPDSAVRQEDCVALDRLLEAYKQFLTPYVRHENEAGAHPILVAYSLVQCAIIHLHSRFVARSTTSRSRCLGAANGAVRALMTLPTRNFKYVNPILAVLWKTTNDVIVGSLGSMRSMRSAWASSSALPGEEGLESARQQLSTAMDYFSQTSPFIKDQLAEIRQARATT